MKETPDSATSSNWMSHSVTLKLLVVIILALLLLVPSNMIRSIILEREGLNSQTTNEVSSKWAEAQMINGPILTIPLIYGEENDDKTTYKTVYWHHLPQRLSIDGNVTPQTLRRGIYEVAVYSSELSLKGSFTLSGQVDRTNLTAIQYDRAFMTIGISDLRGIKEEIIVKWGDQDLKVYPGSRISELVPSGITVDLPEIRHLLDSHVEPDEVQDPDIREINFNLDLQLQGSQNLSFVPLGSTTEVRINSNWTSPSFNGNFLPDTREVGGSGFLASWKVLQLNRNYPQTWTSDQHQYDLNRSAFGVDLILPLDDYQKSMRSIKYAIMTIALTFLIFFLVEILNKRRIHPFQYALVGLALCLFYVLLVSISEHSNFNFAYAISFVGILLMISLYSIRIFKSGKLTFLLVGCLAGIYGFVFVTLQLKDYALLMGSIGLALILGITMYFTRNIDWYKLKIGPEKGKMDSSL
jgi:inner membrane protein